MNGENIPVFADNGSKNQYAVIINGKLHIFIGSDAEIQILMDRIERDSDEKIRLDLNANTFDDPPRISVDENLIQYLKETVEACATYNSNGGVDVDTKTPDKGRIIVCNPEGKIGFSVDLEKKQIFKYPEMSDDEFLRKVSRITINGISIINMPEFQNFVKNPTILDSGARLTGNLLEKSQKISRINNGLNNNPNLNALGSLDTSPHAYMPNVQNKKPQVNQRY